MARYHFVTYLKFGAEPKRVWDGLIQVPEWPSWWKWLERVDVMDRGDADGLGAVFRQCIATPLFYKLTWQTEIVERVDPTFIQLDSSGDLQGVGQFRLRDAEQGETELSFIWLVETGKRWMNFLAPVGRPAFNYAHDRLMTDFGVGLAAAIGTDLLAVENVTVEPGADGFYQLPDGD